MDICLYQGTFNPVHNAHLRVAKFIVEEKYADKVIFIPAYNPPHKEAKNISATDRLNMLKLAIKPFPYFEVSDIEYQRGGISYTYLTICELYKLYSPASKIKFIIGTDAFKKIESWYQSDKLKKLIDFIVFVRENNFDSDKISYLKDKGYNFTLTNLKFCDISSTELRDKIKSGKSISELVPNVVEDYINEHGLYK